MFANGNLGRRSILKGLVALAGAAGIVPAVSMAQDCKLSVHASPQVLYSGQSAGVNVFAHFPALPTPNAPYAFASAAFDVLATDPLWTFATNGAIVGSGVLGINVSQPHQPHMRIYADPSNPYRVWSGVFEPQTDEPALVEIAATPDTFSVYPSQWTSSAAECEAEGGNDFIFVNPLSVGRWLAAPGSGTTLEVTEHTSQLTYSGESGEIISIGLLPSGTPDLRESSSRIEFDGEPVTFTATAQARDGKAVQITSIKLSHEGFERGGHVVGANFSLADGSVRFVAFEGFLGGVRVATGDIDDGGEGEIPGLVVDTLPQTIGAKFGLGHLTLPSGNTYCGTTMVLGYDQPVVVVIRDANGRPQAVTLDRIEVHGIREAAARLTSANNLKQLSLGAHVFEAEGVRQMTVKPGPNP